jgi:hypothetical protein
MQCYSTTGVVATDMSRVEVRAAICERTAQNEVASSVKRSRQAASVKAAISMRAQASSQRPPYLGFVQGHAWTRVASSAQSDQLQAYLLQSKNTRFAAADMPVFATACHTFLCTTILGTNSGIIVNIKVSPYRCFDDAALTLTAGPVLTVTPAGALLGSPSPSTAAGSCQLSTCNPCSELPAHVTHWKAKDAWLATLNQKCCSEPNSALCWHNSRSQRQYNRIFIPSTHALQAAAERYTLTNSYSHG